jgi:hypothetical protein
MVMGGGDVGVGAKAKPGGVIWLSDSEHQLEHKRATVFARRK